MIEKVLNFSLTNEKVVERIISTDDLHFNHVVLPSGEKLPKHTSNADVILTIVRGTVSFTLNDQGRHDHCSGEIVMVPNNTLMNVENNGEEVAEFFIIKAPGPKGV